MHALNALNHLQWMLPKSDASYTARRRIRSKRQRHIRSSHLAGSKNRKMGL